MELLGCQTCENCYHAECMTPSPDPDHLPVFWFCPHCVDNEFHIPPMPSPTSYFTPISPPPQDPTPPANASMAIQANESIARSFYSPNSNVPQNVNETIERGEVGSRKAKTLTEISTTKEQPASVGPNASEIIQSPVKTRRTKNSYSPPRKKSKYSAFSSEVDKALAVIHRELEKAAQVGKSEGNLEDKIKDLEQRLRVQDGQMLLATRELDLAQKNLAAERRHAETFRSEHAQYREEAVRLREEVERKDAELRDWRSKLRSMMGNDLG